MIYSLETASRAMDILLAVLSAATMPGRGSIDDA
jgi:hypothetical protein